MTETASGVAAGASDAHPLATLVVFAYNQEELLGDAITAAFAQDYPNLEIILSDDGSTDDTLSVMRRLTREYRGPHTVKITQTPRRSGLVHHVFHAFSLASGELIVGAAGDDMSYPSRVTSLMKAWRGTGAAGIYSAWNRIDIDGKLLFRDGRQNQHDRDMAAYFPDREVTIAFGAAAAYSAAFLRSVPVPDVPIWAEDYFLSAIAMLQGRDILYLDEPLVAYRQNPQAIRNFSTVSLDFVQYERREQRFFANLAELVRQVAVIADLMPAGSGQRLDRNRVGADIAWYELRANWTTMSLTDRLAQIAKLRSMPRLRWALPRMFGLTALARSKRLAAPLRGKRRGNREDGK